MKTIQYRSDQLEKVVHFILENNSYARIMGWDTERILRAIEAGFKVIRDSKDTHTYGTMGFFLVASEEEGSNVIDVEILADLGVSNGALVYKQWGPLAL